MAQGRSPELPPRQPVEIARARAEILAAVHPLGSEEIAFSEALGRVLAEDVVSERWIPPNDNSAMDGYALRAADAATPPVELRVGFEVAAGHPSDHSLDAREAARILTGAAIPAGADAVVMQEHVERRGERIRVLRAVKVGDHIRPAGADVRPGMRIAASGDCLGPPAIGMLAAIGRTRVRVTGSPRVAVLATGDELVEPEASVAGGRIVSSNSYSLIAALRDCGARPDYRGIARDERGEIAELLRAALDCDAILTTGGVSVGDRDWVKSVLADLGGDLRLWRVRMKPGAPLAFAILGGKPVFALPGNPVSTLVSFEQFVRPALLRMMGHTRLFRPVEVATLVGGYRKAGDRMHFVRVRLEREGGQLLARSTGDQSSGVLLSMLRADGLAIIPADAHELPAGARVPVMRLDRKDLCEAPGF